MTFLLVVGILGIVLLLAGLVLGDLLDGALDVAVPGDLGPGASAAAGAALAAFGFGGLLATEAVGLPLLTACALGAGGAVVVGGATLALSRALLGQPTSPARKTDLYGLFGTVITPIGVGRYGEISLDRDGTRIKLSARAEQPLPVNTAVYVLDVLSDTAVLVAPAQPMLPSPERGPAT